MKSPDEISSYLSLKTAFDNYYAPLVSFAKNFIQSRAECEDIVQEVFVSILEKRPIFPNEVSQKSYLYKAVRNKCYDRIKHKKVKDAYIKNHFHDLKDDNNFMKHVLEEEVARELYQVIETLPKRKKEIIMLSLRNLKNKDIADRLHLKLQTVKTLKYQAYSVLREKFKNKRAFVNYFICLMKS